MASDAYHGKKWPTTVVIPLRTALRCIKYSSLCAIVLILIHALFLGNDGLLHGWPLSVGSLEEQSTGVFRGGLPDQGAASRIHGSETAAPLERWDAAHRLLGEASSTSSSSANMHSSSSSHGGCGGHGDGVEKTLHGTLSFLFFCFIICCLLEHWNLLVPWEWRFPISVVMYIGGIAIGTLILQVFGESAQEGTGFDELIAGLQGAARIDPHALLYIVLPPLLYESASSMWWHVLRKVLPSAIILAGPGVLLNTLLTGFFVKLLFRVHGESPSWEASWLLSTILSATDPVAVVAALAALGAPKKLASLLEGESLLNDGTAVVAAYVFRDWVADESADKYCPGSPPNGFCVIGFFLRVGLGGVIIGLAAGAVLYFWVNWARHRHHHVLEIALVLTAVYGSFFLAEALKMSGVLAVVILGFVMTSSVQTRLSREGHHAHHIILEQIGYACNQVAFFSAGLITALFMEVQNDACDHSAFLVRPWLELAGLYVAIHFTRAAVIISFSPALRRMGYGISWKEGVILVYGGLRGAVGLLMALIVEHNKHIDANVAQMIAFHTSGIVLLTLLINGSTVDEVYRKLQIYPKNAFRTDHLSRVLSKFELDCQKGGIRKLVHDWFFNDCNFESILRCVPNFESIKFDLGGTPLPDMVSSVKKTLSKLEHDSQSHKMSVVHRGASMFEKDFNNQWVTTKALATSNFIEIISSSSDIHNRTDWVFRVEKVKNSKLKYTTSEGQNQPGLYVSARPLRVLLGQEDDPNLPSFEITVPRLERTQIIIGFVADSGEVRHPVPTSSNQVLGELPNSMGFNAQTGEAFVNGPNGREVYSNGYSGRPSEAGEDRKSSFTPAMNKRKSHGASAKSFLRLTATLFQDETGDMSWGAYFSTSQNQQGGPLMVAFGDYNGDFFPAIEFRPEPPPPTDDPHCLDNPASVGTAVEKKPAKAGPKIMFDEHVETKRLGDSQIIGEEKVISLVTPGSAKEEKAIAFSHPETVPLRSSEKDLIAESTIGFSSDEFTIVPCDLPTPSRPSDSKQSEGRESKSAWTLGPGGSDVVPESTDPRIVPTPQPTPIMPPPPAKPVEPKVKNGCLASNGKVGSPTVGFCSAPVAVRELASVHSHHTDCESLAEITLSFEPLFIRDSESIIELIHLLFNTVMRQYTHMHENGILGEQSLAWLRASVGEAMDCAGKEVNAKRALAFKAASRHSHAVRKSMVDKLDSDVSRQSFAAKSSEGDSGMLKKTFSMNFVNANVNGVLSQMRELTTEPSKQQLVGLFEPLVVEYLALETQLGRRDLSDFCPTRLQCLRQIGYKSTRAKVEALWAFIEAHNHVIKEAPNIDRFPDLVKVIEKIMEECKLDLQRIEEIRPRRFYFCKHDLALRVLLNRRLQKLKKLMSEGWITAGDGQGLMDSLWERIVETDQYVPHLQNTPQLDLPNSRSSTLSIGQPNAWDNVDLGFDSGDTVHRELHAVSQRMSCGIFEAARVRTSMRNSMPKAPPGGMGMRKSATEP